MKLFTRHIRESRHIPVDIFPLYNYIYNMLYDLVQQPAYDPKYLTRAYELYRENDNEYDIEIQFDSIPGFDYKKRGFVTGRMIKDFIYDCDFVVQLGKIKGFGEMDASEPILTINANMVKSVEYFEKHESSIRNTLMHELTHYVQYFGNWLALITNRPNNPGYDKDFVQCLRDYYNDLNTRSKNYYMMSFVIYAFSPNERYARVSGFYATIKTEFQELFDKLWNKLKRVPTKDEFVDYVVNSRRYNRNEVHIQHYGNFIKSLEDDTYDKFMECKNDPDTIFRDDSPIYVFLNMCENGNPRPTFLLPKKTTCIWNTKTEEDFNRVKNAIINKFKKNFDNYVKKLRDVVGDVYDEMTKK